MARLSEKERDLILDCVNNMRDIQRQLLEMYTDELQLLAKSEDLWKNMVNTFGGKNFVCNGWYSDYFYMTDGEVEFRETYKDEAHDKAAERLN